MKKETIDELKKLLQENIDKVSPSKKANVELALKEITKLESNALNEAEVNNNFQGILDKMQACLESDETVTSHEKNLILYPLLWGLKMPPRDSLDDLLDDNDDPPGV